MSRPRKKPVRRPRGSEGQPLPTKKELALVDILADRWKVEPPFGYRRDPATARAFIDLLVLSKEQSFADLLRRLKIARHMVHDGWRAADLAEKFSLSRREADVLYDVARQRAQRKWPEKALGAGADEGGLEESDPYAGESPIDRDHLESIDRRYGDGDMTFARSLAEACRGLSDD